MLHVLLKHILLLYLKKLIRTNKLVTEIQIHVACFVKTLCKVVGCASGVGLLPAALGPSFLDKGVGTGLAATQVGSACAQTRPGLPGTCLRQVELFQTSCGRQT